MSSLQLESLAQYLDWAVVSYLLDACSVLNTVPGT